MFATGLSGRRDAPQTASTCSMQAQAFVGIFNQRHRLSPRVYRGRHQVLARPHARVYSATTGGVSGRDEAAHYLWPVS